MARDKLITIRIEGEKRQAFGDLAKSQNTDTASLLYDFISGCLSGKIDIKLVTGKGNRIDKIDNQLDSDRLDKLETATQKIDERLGQISKKLNDWIESFSDRLTDCDRELSEKTISLEHRLNALSIQLDSQEIDSIDTKLNESIARLASCLSQRMLTLEKKIDDMEPLLKRECEASIAAPIPTGETSHDEPGDGGEGDTPEVPPSPPSPALEAIETVPGETDSSIETVTDAIETLPTVETDSSIETVASAIESVTDSKPWYTIDELLDCHYPGWPETKEGLRKKALTEGWPRRTRRGSKGNPYEYQAVLPD